MLGAGLIIDHDALKNLITLPIFILQLRECNECIWAIAILFLCYTLTETLPISSSRWLSIWTAQGPLKIHGPGYYNSIYGIISFGQVLIHFIFFAVVSARVSD